MADTNEGARPDNISTKHQKPGDAMRPQDTLDSENDAAKRPGDFNPGEDAGSAQPSGNPAD